MRIHGKPAITPLGSSHLLEAVASRIVTSLVCRYNNARDRVVVLRCRDRHHATLERVLFPTESLDFDFPAEGVAEVWSHGMGGAELLERRPMHELSA
jgi:predicted nucleotidyltransferase